ncbi:GNAT family N-acetyltransferase [Adlercreutzia aquisgranensis]|uniref:GNAT family N-acetyltransferase n=1 Tax=Adlercreutzia aquisgranensis TaxID=2941323 RepID=UPI0020417B77|nr:GNAT family N-acetyltransferase [Adlercreutzia aquisgranensis]
MLCESVAETNVPRQADENSPRIRPATLEDAPGILAIYRPFIENTAITFEYAVPSLDEFRARMASIIGTYPYLVAEQTQQPSEPEEPAKARIIGYAYAHRMGERAAFQWNAELAVYLAPEAQGQGLGARLVSQLESELSAMGVRNLFSLITADNEPSLRLHEKLGFVQVGYHPSAGYKLGRWHDLVYLRKPIGSFEGEPQPLAQ